MKNSGGRERESETPFAREATAGAGPLTGLKVIEVGSVVAGPFAGRLLGDLGADVVKIEAPGRPDPLRDWGQESYRGHRLWWTVHARNKRCITLHLGDPRGRELFLRLAADADVVVENFRPGTLERWGLGYDELARANPGLVLARISGYGQTGPQSQRPGYASVAEAASGLRFANGFEDRPPPRMAFSIGDSLAGMFAVHGILAALHARHSTGLGDVVDVALSEACLALTESMIPEFDKLGRVRKPGGTRLEGIAPSNLFRSRDDVWVIVAANQDSVFGRLCEALGRPELATDPRFIDHIQRGANQDAIEAIVADWVGDRSADEVEKILDAADVVVGRVATAADVVTNPQFLAREMLVEHMDDRLGEAVLGPGVVPKFRTSRPRVRWAGPARPGEHNGEVYAELGLDADDLAQLGRAGVV